MDVRGLVAVGAGKMAATLSRTLGLGGGTSYPGELARRLDPRLLATLAGGLSRGNVVVTGTNGKTTTSRLIASLMRQAGWRPVHNRSGANLLDGVASALLAATTLGGQIAGDSGLFEVDEAHLPAAVAIGQAMAPEEGIGPLRMVPFDDLPLGVFAAEGTDEAALPASFASVLSDLRRRLAEADARGALPQARGLLIVEEWQADLKRITLRITWITEPVGETQAEARQVYTRVFYIHRQRSGHD